jgi:hypothetical protein
MRKHIHRFAFLIFLVALIPSCELLEDCKSCTLVTEDSSGGTTNGATATYCGTQLAAKEAENVTINGVTTFYDCK